MLNGVVERIYRWVLKFAIAQILEMLVGFRWRIKRDAKQSWRLSVLGDTVPVQKLELEPQRPGSSLFEIKNLKSRLIRLKGAEESTEVHELQITFFETPREAVSSRISFIMANKQGKMVSSNPRPQLSSFR